MTNTEASPTSKNICFVQQKHLNFKFKPKVVKKNKNTAT